MGRLIAAALVVLLAGNGCAAFTRAEAVRWRHALEAAADQRALQAALTQKQDQELAAFDRVQWITLEQQVAQAERELRERGLLTEENSGKLRQRYLAETDRLRLERLRLAGEWARIRRLAESGEENFLALAETSDDVRRATTTVLAEEATSAASMFLQLLEDSPQPRAQAEVLSALRRTPEAPTP